MVKSGSSYSRNFARETISGTNRHEARPNSQARINSQTFLVNLSSEAQSQGKHTRPKIYEWGKTTQMMMMLDHSHTGTHTYTHTHTHTHRRRHLPQCGLFLSHSFFFPFIAQAERLQEWFGGGATSCVSGLNYSAACTAVYTMCVCVSGTYPSPSSPPSGLF